ncbi:hypothetical protein D3C76_1511000 [compost metagenome]
MDPVDQFALMVGLTELDFQAVGMGGIGTALGQVGEGFVAVLGRLTGAQHVQVRAVEHENNGLHDGHRFVVVGCV